MPWATPCFLSQRKNQVKEPLEPTQHELVVKASQEAGFPKRIQDDKKHPWNDPHWSRPDRFRLRGSRSLVR